MEEKLLPPQLVTEIIDCDDQTHFKIYALCCHDGSWKLKVCKAGTDGNPGEEVESCEIYSRDYDGPVNAGTIMNMHATAISKYTRRLSASQS